MRCGYMRARRMIHGTAVVLAASILVAACQKQTAPAAPGIPDPEYRSEPYPTTQPTVDTVPQAPALGTAQPTAAPKRRLAAEETVTSLSPRFQTYFEDFRVAEMALTSASGACEDACRALRSMVRATERMCAIVANEDEQDRCEDARDRVRGAREHVRSACRTCPQGPPLEPNEDE